VRTLDGSSWRIYGELISVGSEKQKGISRGKGKSRNGGRGGGKSDTQASGSGNLRPHNGAAVRRTPQSRVQRADRRQRRDAERGRGESDYSAAIEMPLEGRWRSVPLQAAAPTDSDGTLPRQALLLLKTDLTVVLGEDFTPQEGEEARQVLGIEVPA
jgi:hypothetical protein